MEVSALDSGLHLLARPQIMQDVADHDPSARNYLYVYDLFYITQSCIAKTLLLRPPYIFRLH